MTDFSDRATAREEQIRADAIADQERRAGLGGKTIADSAHFCGLCEDPIPHGRREAMPGVQTCVDCQHELERGLIKGTA